MTCAALLRRAMVAIEVFLDLASARIAHDSKYSEPVIDVTFSIKFPLSRLVQALLGLDGLEVPEAPPKAGIARPTAPANMHVPQQSPVVSSTTGRPLRPGVQGDRPAAVDVRAKVPPSTVPPVAVPTPAPAKLKVSTVTPADAEQARQLARSLSYASARAQEDATWKSSLADLRPHDYQKYLASVKWTPVDKYPSWQLPSVKSLETFKPEEHARVRYGRPQEHRPVQEELEVCPKEGWPAPPPGLPDRPCGRLGRESLDGDDVKRKMAEEDEEKCVHQ